MASIFPSLAFAKKNGFDKVHFQGMIDDFEVYTGDYNETRIVGLPQVIFADEKTVDFAEYDKNVFSENFYKNKLRKNLKREKVNK